MVKIIQLLFAHVCCIFCVSFSVLYFFVSYFCLVLKALYYLRHLLILSVWQNFGQDLKKKEFPWVRQLGLIHYLMICLCLFWNFLSVGKLNCLLPFLLILLILSLHKWYCPIIFSIAFNFHSHYIIKFISYNS